MDVNGKRERERGGGEREKSRHNAGQHDMMMVYISIFFLWRHNDIKIDFSIFVRCYSLAECWRCRFFWISLVICFLLDHFLIFFSSFFVP